MSNFRTEPPTDNDRVESLERAVACLDMIDGRVAERCSVPLLQDVVGNLLLMLARIAEAGGVAGGRPPGDVVSDCRAIALECLTIAGLSEDQVNAAVSAVVLVDGITGLANTKRG